MNRIRRRAIILLSVLVISLLSVIAAPSALACPNGEYPYDPQPGLRGVVYYVTNCVLP